jgi:hypothetical protein
MQIPFKPRTLAAALVATLPCIDSAHAVSFGMDFQGYVTMLSPTGQPLQNSDYLDEPRFHGMRTPISGNMVLDVGLDGLVGSGTFTPFSFAGGGNASGTGLNFVPVSELLGAIPTSTLLLGNMGFDWNGSIGIPVSIVLDIGNLQTALMGSSVGGVIRGVFTPASDDTLFNGQLMPIGPSVVTTTEWNTTNVDTDGDGSPGPIGFGDNPSGTTPLKVDVADNLNNGTVGIGGSPMRVGPFRGYSANFDITEVTVTCTNLLTSCSSGGITLPALPLSPQPLAPLLKGLGGLLK